MAFLEARNLHKTYRPSRHNLVHALRGVDVTVGEGEMVGIVGPSGSGKSTLMHVLGLLHAPDENRDSPPSLVFDGADVTGLPDRERTRIRAERMGFVFQTFNLVPTLTALENVALPAEYSRAGSGEMQRGPPWMCWDWSVSRTGPDTVPWSFPAASSSGRRWPGPW